MKIYLAGMEAYLDVAKKLVKPRVLVSYFNIRPGAMKMLVEANDWDIFLDCGAYSAWTKGITIDVHDYSKFIIKYQDHITVYPNLDVKGNLAKTEENFKIMTEEYGLHPIPVFHVGTQRWDVLEKYIDKYDYIALGAIAGEGMPKKLLVHNLNSVFQRMKRDPLTKFHGFGLTRQWFMEKYPFYSVDSTSWMTASRFGQIMIFKGGKMKGYAKKESINPYHFAHHRVNALMGAKEFKKMETYYTEMWEMRGIKWTT